MAIDGEAVSFYSLWIGRVVDFRSSLNIYKARITSGSQQLRNVFLSNIHTCSRTAIRDVLILRWDIQRSIQLRIIIY